MSNSMRFVTDLSKGVLGQPDSAELWSEIIAHIPDEVLLKPGVRILSVACGHCTEALLIAKRMLALGISKEAVRESIWLIDKYAVFTNFAKDKYGFKNVVQQDFLAWEPGMKFDVVIGNPPYNGGDTSRADSAHRGQGDNLAKKFTLKAIDLSNRFISFVIPYGHRTYSPALAEQYRMAGLFKIDPCSDHFKNVSTNPCVFYFDKANILEEVEDNYNTHTLTIPDSNIGSIFKNQPGQLNRIDYEDRLTSSGKYEIVVTTAITKFTDDESIVEAMRDNTRGNWRVVFNCTTSVGKFGKIIVVGPDAVLSKSVHCLVMRSEQDALRMKEYLETDFVKEILSKVKVINACNSKKFLQYIPMP